MCIHGLGACTVYLSAAGLHLVGVAAITEAAAAANECRGRFEHIVVCVRLCVMCW